MEDEHRGSYAVRGWSREAFTASTRPADRGGWVTTIELGDGASLSRWFENEGDAVRYPGELVEWLAQRREPES